jgi:hypothetical protein
LVNNELTFAWGELRVTCKTLCLAGDSLQYWLGMNYHLSEALDSDLALGFGSLGRLKIGIVYDF